VSNQPTTEPEFSKGEFVTLRNPSDVNERYEITELFWEPHNTKWLYTIKDSDGTLYHSIYARTLVKATLELEPLSWWESIST